MDDSTETNAVPTVEMMSEAGSSRDEGQASLDGECSSEKMESYPDEQIPDVEIVLPYEPVPTVDMDRFLGKWYEIAKLPNRWQANGNLTTVSYIRNPKNQKLRIVSRTIADDNKVVEQSGRLWVLDKTKNSEYKVQFCWPFTGMFWILHVGEREDYGYAVIGDPIKCNLWILSRQPTLEDYVYEKLVAQLEWQGYNLSNLTRTVQSEDLTAYLEEEVEA